MGLKIITFSGFTVKSLGKKKFKFLLNCKNYNINEMTKTIHFIYM